MTRTELLETYLKNTDLTIKELIDRNAFAQIMQFAEAYMLEQLRIGSVIPRFCFVCGSKLEEVSLGWLQCEDEKCGEVFLPYIDKNNNQSLMHQCTPFS